MARCESLAAYAMKLYEQHHEITKDVVSHAAGAAVAVKTGDLQAGLVAQREILEKLDKVDEVIDKLEAAYGKIVKDTSPLKIGPRQLRLDRWERGTILGAGDRMFLTAAPLENDHATLRIRERGGKGKVEIAVCCFDEKGRHRELHKATLNENGREKRDDDQSLNLRLQGVENRWISVVLDGRSVTNKFSYKLMLDT